MATFERIRTTATDPQQPSNTWVHVENGTHTRMRWHRVIRLLSSVADTVCGQKYTYPVAGVVFSPNPTPEQLANMRTCTTCAGVPEEKVFTSAELAQLFDLTFVYSPGWRILVDVHTPAGDGWATMSTWLDSDGHYVTQGKSPEALGRYVADAIRCGCRVRVLQGEKL